MGVSIVGIIGDEEKKRWGRGGIFFSVGGGTSQIRQEAKNAGYFALVPRA